MGGEGEIGIDRGIGEGEGWREEGGQTRQHNMNLIKTGFHFL